MKRYRLKKLINGLLRIVKNLGRVILLVLALCILSVIKGIVMFVMWIFRRQERLVLIFLGLLGIATGSFIAYLIVNATYLALK